MKNWSNLFMCVAFVCFIVGFAGYNNEVEDLCQDIESASVSSGPDLVLVGGGTFSMGDVLGEGRENELPVHQVTVSDFYTARNEVTVGEYSAFIEETGYRTNGESEINFAEQRRIMHQAQERLQSGELSEEDIVRFTNEFLQYGGTFCWDCENRRFGFNPECNWRNPPFEQSERDPAVCLSWTDAAAYCNWLSEKENLPVAYDLETGDLLNENGSPTEDVTMVRGYRLPTEAEWEFAARERGADVRFGNGKNIARADEINFDASVGDYPYLEEGEFRQRTVPVASFEPNSLGLYDMSGNAWEWCQDYYGAYSGEAVINPLNTNGIKRVLRGGRWGGNASNARVFARDPYEQINRCNNSGFRVARSAD